MTWTIGIWEDGGESQVDNEGRIVSTYDRTYLVRTDSPTRPTKKQIIDALGIIPGSPHEEDAMATCNRVKVSGGPEKTRPPFLAFLVDVSWSTAAAIPKENNTDPTTMFELWDIRTQDYTKYIYKDKNGKLILNSAKQPFDGGIAVTDRIGVAVVRRNKLATAYDRGTVMRYSGMVNKKKYLGADPGTLQVKITATERREGGFHWWEETLEFQYIAAGWQPRPLDAGFYYLDDVLFRITQGDLNDPATNDPTPVQEPEPLTQAGLVVKTDDRPDGCRFVEVDYFEELDFAQTFQLTSVS